MPLDDLLKRYFASMELAEISSGALASRIEHCRVDLGLEKDSGERFALWALLHMLGSGPDLHATFEKDEDCHAGCNSMKLLDASKE
ncbi:MAG: hypothetical protein AAF291_00670 [Pseudomonadota bacterium]